VRQNPSSTTSAAGTWQTYGDVQCTRLDNGLTVVVLENPVVPLVTIEIDVKNGAYTETAEYDGLSHLYEHMFFKANARIPDQEAYLLRARELGMEWNGTTSDERVNYFFTLHRKNLQAGLEFMGDAIRTPLFKQDEIERERPVVLGEYDRAESDPMFHMVVAVQKRLWQHHYTRKNVLGTRAIIETATTAKMQTIQKRFYVPNNSALFLSGDIGAQEALPLVEAVFGDWQAGADPFVENPIPAHPPLTRSEVLAVEKPVQAVTMLTALHGPSIYDDRHDTYAGDILSFLTTQRSSRFHQRLIDSGLASSASVNYQSLRYTGPIHIFLRADPKQFAAARAALQEEVDFLSQPESVVEEDLLNAKRQLEIDHIYQMERPSQHVHTVGYWWAIADLDYYATYIERLQQVTRDDVLAYVDKWIVDKPRITGILRAPEMRPLASDVDETILS
jgi:zinc protease